MNAPTARSETRLSVSSAQTDLAVRLLGESPPRLVYLHHQSGTGDMPPAPLLALAGHGIAAPDIRGRGRSVCREAKRHTWGQYADDVVAVLDGLGAASAVLVGMSFGAGVALATQLAHPDRVDGLVLWSSPYAGAEQGWKPEQRRSLQWTFALAESVRDHQGLAGIAARGAADATVDVARESSRWSRHDPVSFATALLAVGYEQPFSTLDQLSTIRVPTVVVPGGNGMHPREIGVAYASAIPGARLVGEDGAQAAIADLLERLRTA